jgi:hypothetical protein
LHFAQDFVRRRDAGVGADQELLQLIPHRIVDLAPIEDAGDAAEPAFARLIERLFGLLVGLFRALEDA